MRAARKAVHSDRDMRLYSDSQWCVDVLKNVEQSNHMNGSGSVRCVSVCDEIR